MIKSRINRVYGWHPSLPDQRDIVLPTVTLNLPVSVDLRSLCPPVYDQGQLGSCTANAIAFHLDFNRKKQGEQFINPARLQIYYNERKDQGTIESDAGSTIRESAKAVKNYGAAPESQWPYDISKFKIRPSETAIEAAIQFEDQTYMKVSRTLNSFKTRLAQGFPFVIGFTVYESFETDQVAKTGIMPMPLATESVLGGHAVAIVGYNDLKKTFIVRNSWGSSWGDEGYFYMPYEYLQQPSLSSDFWTLEKVK